MVKSARVSLGTLWWPKKKPLEKGTPRSLQIIVPHKVFFYLVKVQVCFVDVLATAEREREREGKRLLFC